MSTEHLALPVSQGAAPVPFAPGTLPVRDGDVIIEATPGKTRRPTARGDAGNVRGVATDLLFLAGRLTPIPQAISVSGAYRQGDPTNPPRWPVPVAFMDPYDILGLSRRCTRDEVKAAFRARVWHAHPDRGGQAESFIRLCTAYKQILEELDRHPRLVARNPARSPRDGRPPVPPDRWSDPEIIILDEAPGWNRPPRPPDPNWEPDLILHDQPPPIRRPAKPPDPRLTRQDYISWLRRVSDQVDRRQSVWRSKAVRAIGTLILLSILGGNLWLCWIAWSYDPEEAAREAESEAKGAQQGGAGEPAGWGRQIRSGISPAHSTAGAPRSPAHP
jgi:hypothetical protein